MADAARSGSSWQWGAMWLACGLATVILFLRILLGSGAAEAAAVALLAGVIVYGLAYIANVRPSISAPAGRGPTDRD